MVYIGSRCHAFCSDRAAQHIGIHKHAATNPPSGTMKLIFFKSYDQVSEEMGTRKCFGKS